MQTIYNQFHTNYQVEKMNRASLTIVNKQGEHLFISRNAYNAILQNRATDMREVERTQTFEFGAERTTKWLEVSVWVTF